MRFRHAKIVAVFSRKIRVLVVDHNPLLREGLSVLIRLQPDMELIAAAASAEEAIRLFEEHRPDVTVMDLDLPSGAGIKATQQIRARDPGACVLGLLTYEWDEATFDAAGAGISGCLTKDRLNQDLIPLIVNCARRTRGV